MIIKKIFKTCQGISYEPGYQTNWYPMDTLELFQQNQKNNPKAMAQWQKDSITYKLNHYGFRTELDFDDYVAETNTWIVLGCSHSFGIGLPYDKTYVYLLEQHFKNRIINLSVPAGSIDSCYRVCKAWFNKIRPNKVIIQVPEKSRREFLFENRLLQLAVWDKEFIKFRTQVQEDVNDDFHQVKVLDAIKHVIGQTDCVIFNYELWGGKDKARDLTHAGVKSNYEVFEYVKKIIDQNP